MKIPGIELCGIGDEAGVSISEQIRAQKMLGWNRIELRSVDEEPLSEIPMAKIREIRRELRSQGLTVTAGASRIGNWERPITSDFQADRDELMKLVERGHELGFRSIRIMSYPNDGLSSHEWKERVIERIRRLVEIADREKVILLHENCAGWAGQSPEHTLELLKQVSHPCLRLMFDIGNGIAYGYESLPFLKKVHPYVAYVHIKDGQVDERGEVTFTEPGQGRANVAECLNFLLEKEYRGVWSIEPHIARIPHLAQRKDAALFSSYIRYGNQLKAFIDTIFSSKGEGYEFRSV